MRDFNIQLARNCSVLIDKSTGILEVFRTFWIEKRCKFAARWSVKNRILRCYGYSANLFLQKKFLRKFYRGHAFFLQLYFIEQTIYGKKLQAPLRVS
jgi:hypothetical protein